MKVFSIILLFLVGGMLYGQAELEKVRAMFPEPNTHLDVEIWKGHMEYAHPVEFFYAVDQGTLRGYYRIISSGDEFLLEGEINGSSAVISEIGVGNEVLGLFEVKQFEKHETGQDVLWTWFSQNRKDLVEFRISPVSFSDYPPGLFYPKVKKYIQYDQGSRKSLLIEQLNPEEVYVTLSQNAGDESHRLDVHPEKPYDFELVLDESSSIFNEVNGTLRERRNNGISFYTVDNTLQIKPMTYASQDFLCNIEYPETSNEAFNTWMKDQIDERRKKTRKEVARLQKKMESSPSELHYHFKWKSWTEIDFLSNDLISGRMVFIRSWDNSLETLSFQYDLRKNEPFEILDEFKSDFNMRDYLDKFLKSELNKQSKDKLSKYVPLTVEDFTEMSFSDHYLILGTAFHWEYGYRTFRIPFTELEGLLKRNSILKPIMKT